MKIAKKKVYTERQVDVARLAKALGHPARVAIVDYLLKVNTCICGDIVDELPLAQATVSQHLKELKNAGLIKGSIEGNTICYCLDQNVVETLQVYLDHLTTTLRVREEDCC